jgi:hypothetical protein
MREINIDCYGRFHLDKISVEVNGITVNFIYNDLKKANLQFMLGLFFDYHSLNSRFLRYPFERRICVLSEPLASHYYYNKKRLVRRYKYIFTHDKLLLDRGGSMVELLFGTNWIEGPELKESFTKQKLLSFIGAVHPGHKGGHGFRNKVVEKLLNNPKADCFGKGVKEIKGKITGLANYAFSIAMENHQQDYYFSEKINDCFLSDTVPIYWGCQSIGQFFDKRGIIIFNSLHELLEIIDSLDMDLYYEMLPYVKKNKEKSIKNKWHSLQGMYERLGQNIIEKIEFKKPVRFRPVFVEKIEKLNRIIRIR